MKIWISLVRAALGATMFCVPVVVAAQRQIAYGVDSNVDSLYTIDLQSGAITIVGPLGSDPSRYTTPIALGVRRSDGAFFVANNSPEGDRGISRVDPTTGRATLVVPSDQAFYGLTFDASDRLVVQLQSGTLAYADLNTRQLLPFGGADLPILYSMATNPIDGKMYGLSRGSSATPLHQISPSGSIASTVDIPLGFSYDISTMAFDASGTMHLISSAVQPERGLYEVDPETGVLLSDRIAITFPYIPQGFAFGLPVRQSVPALSLAGVLLLVVALSIAALGSTLQKKRVRLGHP